MSHIFIVAGEPSGDQLGASLMAGLKAEAPGIRFTGVGGPLMEAEGLRSLFPMDDLSVMGLAEVLPRLPLILRRIRETGDAVIDAAPDALLTIDSPDFCLRVAKRARAARPDLKTIHYVAPSVWAWRPGRAAKMARVIDHVLALLPFEPPYMTAAGMGCDFVGHPVTQSGPPPVDELRNLVGAGRLLVVLPGSRAGEVARHGPLFREVSDALLAKHPDLRVVLPTVAARAEAVRSLFDGAPGKPLVISPDDRPPQEAEALKRAAFAEASAALAVSGTVSLELAAAGAPMAVAYRANPISAFLARRMVTVKWASLVNIVLDEGVIPEFIFDKATPSALIQEMDTLLSNPEAAARQTARFDVALRQLGRGDDPPGLRAARAVLRVVNA